jgi:hypothetical protein
MLDVDERENENQGDGKNGFLRVGAVYREMDHKYIDDV